MVAAVILTGCTGPQNTAVTVPAPAPLAMNTTVPVTQTPAPVSPASPATTPEISMTPDETASVVLAPVPSPDPTDVSKITFLRYSDSDFSVDYPSTWTITTSTYTPYYCKNEVDVETAYYRVCYENEMKSIGPFSFYQDDSLYKSPARIVTIQSADGTIKFVAFTRDFLDQLDGNVIVVPSFAWIKDEFQKMYPDLYAVNYVANYRDFSTGNAKALSYDVVLPAGHYPSAYTEEVIITVHHLNRFAFITDNEKFTRYQTLRQKMIASIQTHDI
jgi:hypothetical protein